MPVQVPISAVVAIAAGRQHSLALTADGLVWAWGFNADGELGTGNTNSALAPVQVVGLTNVTAISTKGYHSLALTGDDTVWAWGVNTAGQLGDGTTATRSSPVQVSGLSGVLSVAGGLQHSLALTAGGAMAWGANGQGQLGNGTLTDSSSPVTVLGPGGTPLQHVSGLVAGSEHSQAVTTDGSLWLWGVQPGPLAEPFLQIATATAPPIPDKKVAKRTKQNGDGNNCQELVILCTLPPLKQSGKCPFTQVDPVALGTAILNSIQQGQFAPVDTPITEAAFGTQVQMRWGRVYFGKWHVEKKDDHQYMGTKTYPPGTW